MKCNFWIHNIEYDGNHYDYRVSDLNDVKEHAILMLKHNACYVCDNEIFSQIESLLETDWEQAVELYNKHNCRNEFFEYGEIQ
jgi:hypothetical protein